MTVDSGKKSAKRNADKLICESCGAEFFCAANIGECWCFTVEVKAETLAELKENYKSCLCQDCLKEIKENAHNSN